MIVCFEVNGGLSHWGWLLQVRVLVIRNCRMYMRNQELMLAKLFTYIFMGGYMGGSPAEAPDTRA